MDQDEQRNKAHRELDFILDRGCRSLASAMRRILSATVQLIRKKRIYRKEKTVKRRT